MEVAIVSFNNFDTFPTDREQAWSELGELEFQKITESDIDKALETITTGQYWMAEFSSDEQFSAFLRMVQGVEGEA